MCAEKRGWKLLRRLPNGDLVSFNQERPSAENKQSVQYKYYEDTFPKTEKPLFLFATREQARQYKKAHQEYVDPIGLGHTLVIRKCAYAPVDSKEEARWALYFTGRAAYPSGTLFAKSIKILWSQG